MAQVIKDKQDMTHLSWTHIRSSSGTAGSFLKATDDLREPKVYYKLSNYDNQRGVTGHECVNEIIADRLLSILGVEHLNYILIHADIIVEGRKVETYLCESEDFKKRGETKVALDVYYGVEKRPDETPMDFCLRNGWGEYVYQFLAVDFLILNRDRHGANMEVLRNSKEKTVRLAPIFDNGLSLLFNCHTEEQVQKFDPMEDKPVQCFVGSRSTRRNLELIPADAFPAFNRLTEEHRDILLEDLDGVMPRLWLDKIWDMIWRRWKVYEDFRNTRRGG